jgi:hypothetical protein
MVDWKNFLKKTEKMIRPKIDSVINKKNDLNLGKKMKDFLNKSKNQINNFKTDMIQKKDVENNKVDYNNELLNKNNEINSKRENYKTNYEDEGDPFFRENFENQTKKNIREYFWQFFSFRKKNPDYSQFYKGNFITRRLRQYKTDIFFKFMFFFGFLVFCYSFGKFLAIGRSNKQQLQTLLDFQKKYIETKEKDNSK